MAGKLVKLWRFLLVLPAAALLGGCDMVLMNPSGDVALQQRNLILASTGLMLLIIVPVIAATVTFAWRYRAANSEAVYTPDWHHSTQLEVMIWTAPLLIVIALGALTWISTHVLDPFRPITRIDGSHPVPAGAKRLTVEVVALDWKWLFFYPDQGVATINELAAPVDVPIDFKITSATVMNTFFVPALAGQIYAMAGMETRLSAVINTAGVFEGFSANYSGAGFSHMNFKFHGLSQSAFDAWVGKVKQQGAPLDLDAYQTLERPSQSVPVAYFSTVRSDLYSSILNLCAEPGKMCMSQMMAIDASGGSKDGGEATRERLKYDGAHLNEGSEGPGATFPATKRLPESDRQRAGAAPDATKPDQQKSQLEPGAGHDMPPMDMQGMASMSPAPSQPHDH